MEPTPSTFDAWMAATEARLKSGDDRMTAIESKLDKNTTITQEVYELLLAAKGAFKFFSAMGTVVGWIGKIAAAGIAIWGAFYALTHGGRPPGGN